MRSLSHDLEKGGRSIVRTVSERTVAVKLPGKTPQRLKGRRAALHHGPETLTAQALKTRLDSVYRLVQQR